VEQHADMLQVGSRNMQNFPLLKEVGLSQKPVLLKRGMMATLAEYLNAAEYILSQGNPNIVLCERGIRTFETATRYTLDLNIIPLIKQRTPPAHYRRPEPWHGPSRTGACDGQSSRYPQERMASFWKCITIPPKPCATGPNPYSRKISVCWWPI
jgi:hypothetical protein